MSIRNTYPTIRPSLNLDFARSRTLDPRITFSRTTTGTYMDSDGLIKVASADEARFDHRYVNGQLESLGLLVEEQRENLVKNNTMQGAIAGIPGTAPTTWTIEGNGLTEEIVDVGTENGINYIDVRFSGIPTANNFFVRFGSIQGYTTSTNYTLSAYMKIVGGSISNISTRHLRIRYNLDGGGSTDIFSDNLFMHPSTTPLSEARLYGTGITEGTLTGSGIVFTQFNFSPGNNIDITLRIGMPQLEEGSFMTSVIPTSGSTATRNPDNVSMTGDNFSDWYNPTEGTFSWHGSVYDTQYSGRVPFRVTEGSNLRGIGITLDGRTGTDEASFGTRNNTSLTTISSSIPYVIGNTLKIAGAFGTDVAASFDGSVTQTDSPSYTFGTENRLEIMGNRLIGGSVAGQYNGHTRKLSYYPRRLSNSQLQNLTK